MNRQQMKNFAAKFLNDVRQLFFEIAKCARRRNDGEIFFVKRFELGFKIFVHSRSEIFCFAEKPRERAVNCVCGSSKIWVNRNANVVAIGPMLPFFFVEQIDFGFEKSDFGERNFDFPNVVVFLHGQIAPGNSGGGDVSGVRGNNFFSPLSGAAKIGPQKCAEIFLRGIIVVSKRETDFVADETKDSFAGRGDHDWIGPFHFMEFQVFGFKFQVTIFGTKIFPRLLWIVEVLILAMKLLIFRQ
jgi:hypothetical protein